MAMKKSRMEQLKNMPMPKKPMGAEEAEMDLESLASDSEEEPAEMTEESGYMGPLESFYVLGIVCDGTGHASGYSQLYADDPDVSHSQECDHIHRLQQRFV